MSAPSTTLAPAPIRANGGMALVALTRPRVLGLVVFTGLPALFLGPTVPGPGRAVAILLATLGVGAACSVLNAVCDRDIDALMSRTRDRPLPSGAVDPAVAWLLGLVLASASTAMLFALGGVLAATLGAGTIAFYVGVYTLWLKRRTPMNIVIGGASGASAPLIVDAAANGGVSVTAAMLSAVIFLWTPAHFWAIALYRRDEYAAANIPMMPAVVGARGTALRMLGYGLATVLCTLGIAALGVLTPAFSVLALVAGLAFLSVLASLAVQPGAHAARKAFAASNLYLLLIFSAVVIDLALFGG